MVAAADLAVAGDVVVLSHSAFVKTKQKWLVWREKKGVRGCKANGRRMISALFSFFFLW